MTSLSKRLSPVVLHLIAEVSAGEESKVVNQATRFMGMAEGTLKATMHNEIKLSNVIAKFSTFTTGITVEIPITTPDEFRTAVHRFHNEIIQAIQEFQNETLVKIGREPAWGDGNALAPHLKAEEPEATRPTGEEILNAVLGEGVKPKRTPKKA